MADNVHEQGLLAPLLEQEKARMQAAFNQQFQGSFARLRESIDSSRNNLEQRVTVLEKDLQAANQHNETLKDELGAAKESIKNFTKQLRVANQRANASEKESESARSIAEEFITQLAKAFTTQRVQPETDLEMSQQDQSARHKKEHGHKRKASTEHPRPSEGDSNSKPDLTPATAALVASPVSDERLDPALRQPTDMDLRWTGPVNDAFTEAKFQAVISRVSAIKPVNTFERPWTTLMSKNVDILHRVGIEDVTKHLRLSRFDPFADTIVLRLEPAFEADKAAFGQVFDGLDSSAQCGTLYSLLFDEVVKATFLIPARAGVGYHEVVSMLNPSGLPQVPTENMLLLVIIYEAKAADRYNVRLAWDDLIKAVHGSDVEKLAGMRDTILLDHPFPILNPRGPLLSRPSNAFDKLDRLPAVIHGAELGPHSHMLHHISYALLDEARAASVDGVKLPECVFILGVVTGEGLASLLLVDMMARDRHLWHFRLSRGFLDGGCSGAVGLTPLRTKFPGSLVEWKSSITQDTYTAQHDKMVKFCLKIERYGPLN